MERFSIKEGVKLIGDAIKKSDYDPDKRIMRGESREDDTLFDIRNCPIDGNNGCWNGERGNSTWIPDDNYIPEKYNPNHQSWKDIKKQYGIDGIPFKDGEPDFSEVSKGEVEIETFTVYRSKNFAQADERLAAQKGCEAKDVRRWREYNRYTWHEHTNCKTMSKIPNIIHLNITHRGGVASQKEEL